MKDKSTEIFPPLLLKPLYICVHVMPKAKIGQQKVQILKKICRLCPSRILPLRSKRLLCNMKNPPKDKMY